MARVKIQDWHFVRQSHQKPHQSSSPSWRVSSTLANRHCRLSLSRRIELLLCDCHVIAMCSLVCLPFVRNFQVYTAHWMGASIFLCLYHNLISVTPYLAESFCTVSWWTLMRYHLSAWEGRKTCWPGEDQHSRGWCPLSHAPGFALWDNGTGPLSSHRTRSNWRGVVSVTTRYIYIYISTLVHHNSCASRYKKIKGSSSLTSRSEELK